MTKLRLTTAALIATAVAVVAVGAPAATSTPTAAKKNLVQTAVAAGQFKTLVSLVKQAGLAKTLSGNARYTVFAPTDAAFAKVPKATLRRSRPTRRSCARCCSTTSSPAASPRRR